ncbi:MAG TPA: hypothetical protein VN827_02735 [Chthoniobacterales bacterium]|nr:hypothetical protein [Chthoniobacterales bacterium]
MLSVRGKIAVTGGWAFVVPGTGLAKQKKQIKAVFLLALEGGLQVKGRPVAGA